MVCDSGRAVITTSWPAASRRSTSGRSTTTCAVLVRSTQTRTLGGQELQPVRAPALEAAQRVERGDGVGQPVGRRRASDGGRALQPLGLEALARADEDLAH